MRTLVLKFGGTSVRYGYNKIINLISKLKNDDRWDKIIIVISALSQVTNMLIDGIYKAKNHDSYSDIISNIFNAHMEILLSNEKKNAVQAYIKEYLQICKSVEVLKEVTPKIEAKIMSYGEIMSLNTLDDIFTINHIDHKLVFSTDFIITDSTHLNALVNFKKTSEEIKKIIDCSDKIILTNGFLGKDDNNIITTLGRGGSDYTATLIASLVNAEEVHIYSDVDGILSGDPKKIKNAFLLNDIHANEASELAFFGAKILHPRTIQPLIKSKINLRVLNTFSSENRGTLISHHNISNTDNKKITAVTSINNMSLITVRGNGILGRIGTASGVFNCVSQLNINIPFITQASSETSICFAIDKNDTDNVINAINEKFKNEIECDYINSVIKIDNISLITVVGSKMSQSPGIAGSIFTNLGNNQINIIAISQGSSEISITLVVNMSDELKTLNVIHNLILDKDERNSSNSDK